MKILVVGDIVGRPGRKTLRSYLEKYKENYDFIIVNGENSAAGFGITAKIADEIYSYGCNVITSGNHIWDKKEIYSYLNENKSLLRPLNYPEGAPGLGYTIHEINGKKIAVMSLQGRVFMPIIDCPFKIGKAAIDEIRKETNIIIVDFHAEATAEKIALAWYLDGLVSCVYGTHTHVQTADERILDKGTSFISDIGMTGSENGVIGTKKEIIIEKFLNALPSRFDLAEGKERLHGIELEIDENTGKTIDIKRVNWGLE